MLADLVVWINTHYLSLFLLMLAGFCFALAGLIGVFIVRRREVVLGDDDVPVYVPPAPPVIARPVKTHAAPEETRDLRPRIPGALPPETVAVERFVEAVDDATEVLAEMTGVPRHLAQPGVSAWETFERIEGLRVIPSAGPTCPTCGGSFGNCACYSQKSSSEQGSAVTQVVDLCPLTTQDIVIPDEGEAPFAEAVAEHRNRHRETQELSAHMASIRDRERVA